MDIMLNKLKSANLKLTQARRKILEALTQSNVPLTVDMIGKKIKQDDINQVTIYRTIEAFVSIGIVSRVDLRQGAVYYEILDVKHHHHHIICKKCGDLEDFSLCQLENLSLKVLEKSKKFNIIDEHSLEFFGVCKTCK